MNINFLLYKDNRYHLCHCLWMFISKWWKEISDDEIFWFSDFLIFFSRNDIVWKKIYKSIKIQFPIALKNTNIKRTFSGKCVSQILSIFYKLTVLWASAILFLKYSMCIVWVGKLWKRQTFFKKKNCFWINSLKNFNVSEINKKHFFLKVISLIRVSMNYA